MSRDKRYLIAAGLTVGSCMMLAAAINLIVDPYGFYRWVDIDGFNAVKSRAGQQVARNKAHGLAFRKPGAVILGNSRAEIGFDPASSEWPAGINIYNAGIPGTGVATTVRFMEHAVARGHVRLAVIGLDFLDFFADPASALPSAENAVDRSTAMDSRSTLDDAATAIFSLDAVSDSLVTILDQRNPHAANITSDGFNPMRDYEGIASAEGYGALFLQRNRDNANSYLKKRRQLEPLGPVPGPSWVALGRLRAICNEETIRCHFLIYPYHADILEMFDAAGLWPLFESWKRDVVSVLASQSTDHYPAGVLWDFSGYNQYATERVPQRSNRSATMRWYWEAGHFKSALGEKMLGRMLNGEREDFGTRLNSANIDQHLQYLRAQRDRYRAQYPDASKQVRDLVRAATNPR